MLRVAPVIGLLAAAVLQPQGPDAWPSIQAFYQQQLRDGGALTLDDPVVKFTGAPARATSSRSTPTCSRSGIRRGPRAPSTTTSET